MMRKKDRVIIGREVERERLIERTKFTSMNECALVVFLLLRWNNAKEDRIMNYVSSVVWRKVTKNNIDQDKVVAAARCIYIKNGSLTTAKDMS